MRKYFSLNYVGWLLIGVVIATLLWFFSTGSHPKELFVVVAGDVNNRYQAIGRSIKFGADESQKKLGILPNDFKISVKFYPDAGNPKRAEQVALNAVVDPSIIAVIGHSDSGTTAAALKVYSAYDMPILMPVATMPELTSLGYSNVYRLVPKDNLQASTLVEFCKEKFLQRKEKVAILNDGTPYGQGLSQSIKATLSNQGITSSRILDLQEDRDFKKYFSVNDSLGVIIFAGYYPEASILINNLRNEGFKQPIALTDGCFPSDIFDEITVEPGEVYVSFIAPDWNNKEQESAKELMQQAKNQSKIDLSFAPFAYDGFHIIHDAATQILGGGSKKLDRTMILKFLKEHRTFSDPSYIGGPYAFDRSGDNSEGRNFMYKIQVKGSLKSWKQV
jgi:branched-chain amino acid transport system substrate-binding protein